MYEQNSKIHTYSMYLECALSLSVFMYVYMYVCMLNTDDLNYTIKTLSLCMHVCMTY
jgi:hypothetical protein